MFRILKACSLLMIKLLHHADVSFRHLEWIDGKMLKEERRGLVAAYHTKWDKGGAPTQVCFTAFHLMQSP